MTISAKIIAAVMIIAATTTAASAWGYQPACGYAYVWVNDGWGNYAYQYVWQCR